MAGGDPTVEALGARLAGEMRRLFEAVRRGDEPDWPAFDAAALDHLDRLPPGVAPNAYFGYLGNECLPERKATLAATGVWEHAIGVVIGWEERNKTHLHKGTGYYFAGVRDVARGNLDRAFLYMHQAAMEDLWPETSGVPDSPAGRFIIMDARQPIGQAHAFVARYEGHFDERLTAYHAAGRGSMDLAGFRNRVHRNPTLLTPATSLVHLVARILANDGARLGPIMANAFAPSLRAQLALDLCLLVEDVLQRQALRRLALGGLIAQAKVQRVSLSTNDLGALNTLTDQPSKVDAVVADLLDNGRATGLGRSLTPREADFAVAYIVRNRAAHGGERATVLDARFDEVVRRLFFALFAALEDLYDR